MTAIRATDHHINAIRIARELLPSLGIMLPESFWAEFPLDPDQENAAFTMHQQLTFHRRLLDTVRDPLLGLKMAPLFPLQAYGMFGFAIQCAPDMRTGLRFADQFDQLSYTLHRIDFTEEDEQAFFRFNDTGLNLGPRLRAFFAERDIGSAFAGSGSLSLLPAGASRIIFQHEDRGLHSAYEDFFHCPVEFNSHANGVILSNEALDRPNPYRNMAAFENCKQACERQVEGLRRSTDLAGQVRDELFKRPGYLQDIESIAHHLHTSTRTLRRRLDEQGTNFKDLVQDVRFQQARDHLRNRKLSISEIADILGYSEAANFSTAFKRWTGGQGPRDYRREL